MKRFFSLTHSTSRFACVAILAMLLAGCASTGAPMKAAAPAVSDALRKEMAPSGKLRVSVLIAPAPGTMLSQRTPQGAIQGVTATLGTALAQEIGVPVELVPVATNGALFDSIASKQADVTFTQAEPSRRQEMEYGPRYAKTEMTFLVSGKSGIQTLEDINKANTRILLTNNSPFTKLLQARYPNAQFVSYAQADEGGKLLAEGKAEALFFGRNALDGLARKFPDTKVLSASVIELDNVIAVPKDRPLARAYAADFMERAKTSGLVRKALDDAGLKNIPVAQ